MRAQQLEDIMVGVDLDSDQFTTKLILTLHHMKKTSGQTDYFAVNSMNFVIWFGNN